MTTHIRREAETPLDAEQRERVRRLVRHSVSVIQQNQAPSGAYPASPNFRVYRFSWFRDGAFIADAMSRVGRGSSSDAFFRWCADVVVARRAQIVSLLERSRCGEQLSSGDFLPCRYTLDGRESEEEWWEFQLDGYGTWLWAVNEHARRTGASLSGYAEALDLTARYLTEFWATPCYDWWEEHPDHRHTSTLAAVHGGLAAASGWGFLDDDVRAAADRAAHEIRARVLDEGVRDGHLAKWLGGDSVDASLVACATPFRLLEPLEPLMVETVRVLEGTIAHGGVHRYAADTYFGGGEWLLLAAYLGWYYAEVGRTADACTQLLWVASKAALNGDLPEQVNDHLLAPRFEQTWIDRWGVVASPLLWSHAMFLTLADALGLADDEAAALP